MHFKKNIIKLTILFIMAVLYTLLANFLISYFPVLKTVNLRSADKFRNFIYTKQANKPDERIVLVGIDTKTQDYFASSLYWQRKIALELVKIIENQRPKLILLDIPLTQTSDPIIDKQLGEIIRGNKNILLVTQPNEDLKVPLPLPIFTKNINKIGVVAFSSDIDFLVRRIQIKGFEGKINSLGILALSNLNFIPIQSQKYNSKTEKLLFSNCTIPLLNDGSAYIAYNFEPKAFKYFSAYNILKREISTKDFFDKIIIISQTEDVSEKKYPTPIGSLSRLFILGYSINNFLQNSFIEKISAKNSLFVKIFLYFILMVIVFFTTSWVGLALPLVFIPIDIFIQITAISNKFGNEGLVPFIFGFLLFFHLQIFNYISILQRMNKLQKQAITDSLTQAYIRRYFDVLLQNQWHHAKISQEEDFSFFILDIDDFKRINDTYGHLCGDYILKELVAQIKKVSRKTDIVCRYGGEEFVVFSLKTSKKEALHVAKRICKIVSLMPFNYENNLIHITVSIGVVSFGEISFPSQEAMITYADNRLYEAKHLGKNRVVS